MLLFDRGDLSTRPPDPNCHILNATAIVADPGDGGQPWHADDMILIPRPADVPWDDRIPYPVYTVTAMYYLVDVDSEMGPTLVVPGSHKSGRKPDPTIPPSYLGRESEEVHVKAGDCLLFHHQLWHRALPHRGAQTRHMIQIHYAARFVAQRMFPFPNHHTPVAFLDRLTPRQQRLMGMHSSSVEYC
jgi:ectoine hydroxylase-related dioxygenase (phytanoyl-CoA dioxygenase family)